jgi:RHS repeat-associated protein
MIFTNMQRKSDGSYSLLLILLSIFISTLAHSSIPTTYEELDNLNRYKEEIKYDLVGLEGFTEQVEHYNGGLSVGHRDFVLPGNGGLDIEISRYYSQPARTFSHSNLGGSAQSNEAKSTLSSGWNVHFGYITHFTAPTKAKFEERMGDFAKPTGTELFTGCYATTPKIWTAGTWMLATKEGRQENLYLATSADSLLTKSGWRGGCAETGFIIYSPSGEKYVFDQLKFGAANDSAVKSYAWYVSRIEDKHGNSINIHYTSSEQAIIDYVDTSDGRRVDFTHELIANAQTLTKISSATKTIDYGYDANRNLQTVKVGQNVLWQYSYKALDGYYPGSDSIYLLETVTTGSDGTYAYEYDEGISGAMGPSEPRRVNKRTVSGNLPNSVSTYRYKGGVGAETDYPYNNYSVPIIVYEIADGILGSHISRRKTTVVKDNKCEVYRFNAEEQGNWLSGQLAYKTTYKNSGCIGELEKQTYHYDAVTISNSSTQRDFYAYYIGLDGAVVDSAIFKAVLRDKTTVREGNAYNVSYEDFSPFGSPKKTIEDSSTNNKRTVENTYLNPGLAFGIDILDIQTVKDNGGSIVSQLSYDHDVIYNITKKTKDGKSNSYEYHTDGSLKKVTYTGSSRYDLLEDYYRGKARKITQPCAVANTCSLANASTANTVVLKKEVYADGRTKSIIDFRGNKVSYSYDAIGRLTKIDYADTKWADTIITYGIVTVANDDVAASGITIGSLKQTVTRGNFKTVIYHDGLSRPYYVMAQDITNTAATRYSYIEYDIDGQQILTSFPSFSASHREGVENTFDALGRQLSTINTVDDAVLSSIAYLADYKVATTDGENNTTTTTFLEYSSPSYALPSLIDAPDSANTVIQYNALEQITSVTQGVITESRFYDANSRLCKTVRPDVGMNAYGYNARGQMAWYAEGTDGSQTSCDATAVPASHKVTLAYNTLNQLRTENFPDTSPDRTYSYDEDGNLTGLLAGSVSHVYSYNSLGLLDDETMTGVGKTFVLGYEYDSLGGLSALTYPDGDRVTYVPNAFGEPKQAVRDTRSGDTSGQTYASLATYYPNGSINTFSYGNGLSHETTLNNRQIPSSIVDSASGVTALSYGYTYDNNLNITSISDNLNSAYSLTSFTYDGVDRLKSTTGGTGIGSSSINYDTLGNITYYSSKDSVLNYTYNYAADAATYGDTKTNVLRSVSGTGSASKSYAYFSYDERGNVTGNSFNMFEYNLAKQMMNATHTQGTHTYTYDGQNRRVKQTDSKGTSYSLYSQAGTLLYRETDDGGINYIYLGKKLIAKDGVIPKNGSKQHYRPFGSSIEGEVDDVGYTGHKYDEDLGLSYMQARYYDPVIGRFMSNDSVGFDNIHNFNRYAYAANNPYKYIDPDGKDFTSTYISLKIPFLGSVDVGDVSFSPNADGNGDTTSGIFIRFGTSASNIDSDSDGGFLKQTPPIKGVIGGLTLGKGAGSQTNLNFDDPDASIEVGLGLITGSVGSLNSDTEFSGSAELGISFGADATISKSFTLTGKDVSKAASTVVGKVKDACARLVGAC